MEIDILNELKERFGLSHIKKVKSKHGVHIYHVKKQSSTYYLKYFENMSDAFEVECYKVLSKTELPIISYFDSTPNAILLEDMNENGRYRLGKEQDFVNVNAIKSIARWFRELHEFSERNEAMFSFLNDETLEFTHEDVSICDRVYAESDFADLLSSNLAHLNRYIAKCPRIAIHGDFYYKNFFVDTESDEIVMFDFNFMKKGLRSQEISLIRRNLKSGSTESEKLFNSVYGAYDEQEYRVYEVYRHLKWLVSAQKLEEFPEWALESQRLLKEGILYKMLKTALQNFNYNH